MPVNYGITVGLEIHKNWNNFNWKLPGLLQGGLPIFTKTEDISHFFDHMSISFKSDQ
jgi:hypothetical protein